MIEVKRVSQYVPKKLEEHAADTPAAVLIPILMKDGDPQILFTVRSKRLSSYGEQVAFPGGKSEPADKDLAATALRESHEEIGIPTEHVEIIGQIDDFVSGKGHRVTPFVGIVRSDEFLKALTVSPEVSRVIIVPIKNLLSPIIETEPKRGRRLPMYVYVIDDIEIWGLTGAILTRFVDIISDCSPPRPICNKISA